MALLGRSRLIASYAQKRLFCRENGFGNLLCNVEGARRFGVSSQVRLAPENSADKEQAPVEETEAQKLLAEKDKLIAEKEQVVADFKDKYLRALAENENIIARNKKLMEDAKLYGIQSFAKDLLDVADILEKATESVPKEEIAKNSHLNSLFEGLTMTGTQLQKVFKVHGLEKIDPVDEKFDPNFHEALFMQPFPGKEAGTVAVVTKIGYRLHGRPLRAALVGVVQS